MKEANGKNQIVDDTKFLNLKKPISIIGDLALSLTLRDAQHVSWKNFKLINEKLDPEKAKTWTPSVTAVDLLKKAEELVSAVKAIEESKPTTTETKEALATKLSNLLYPIFILGEHYTIEIEESFLQNANDYLLQFIK